MCENAVKPKYPPRPCICGSNPPAKSESPGPLGEQPCNHDYEFLYSEYEKTNGSYNNNYRQIDVFYCRKCLEYKRKVARNEDLHYRPDWYERGVANAEQK